jgi:hypothetical protein
VQSSNFSAPDASFASFLARSLDVLARELPWAYAKMCETLEGRHVSIELDGQLAVVACSAGTARVTQNGSQSVVECRTTRTAVIALADARTTLTEAVVSEQVWLRGCVEDLLAFHDGLMVYLGGAVRSPSFPGLLREFRGSSWKRPYRREA